MSYSQKIEEAVDFLRNQGIKKSEYAIILGTGLGGLVDEVEVYKSIDYKEIPNFPLSTVETHNGQLIQGEFAGKIVSILQGRFHMYEGYNMLEITFPLRVLEALDAKFLFASNAAGAINPKFNKGDLMIIEDHINLQGDSPLAFSEVKDLGERFVDMIQPYDQGLITKAEEIASKEKITTRKGTYASVVGPQLETRAEYKYLNTIGADAVGMSTVPEVIVANQLKMKTLALSVLTDECDPIRLKSINIPEIIEVAHNAQPNLTKMIRKSIEAVD